MDDQIRNEVFEYLDDLRESGETNMFGARPYLMEEFGFDQREATRWLAEWMQTFSERHPRPNRTENNEE
jgi:hypothetical protein